MKNIILISFLAVLSTTPAYADGGHGRYGGGRGGWHGGGWGWGGAWIVPALIGGAIAYDLTRPQPVYVQPAPVYVPNYAPSYLPFYAAQAAPVAAQNWYFCAAANNYYPYVSSCPSGWQVVPAMPPDVVPNGAYRASPTQ